MIKKFLPHWPFAWIIPMYISWIIVNKLIDKWELQQKGKLEIMLVEGNHDDKVWAQREIDKDLFHKKKLQIEYWIWERGFYNTAKLKKYYYQGVEAGLINSDEIGVSAWVDLRRDQLAEEARIKFGYDDDYYFNFQQKLDPDILSRSDYDKPTLPFGRSLYYPVKDADGNIIFNEDGKIANWTFSIWKTDHVDNSLDGAFTDTAHQRDAKFFTFGNAYFHDEFAEECDCQSCTSDKLSDEKTRAWEAYLKKEDEDHEAWLKGELVVPFHCQVYYEEEKKNAPYYDDPNNLSPLDSFLILNDNSNYIFNNLLIDLLVFSFSPIFFLIIIFSNNIKFLNFNIIILASLNFLKIFYNIFKNLVSSLRSERFFNFVLAVFVFIIFSNLAGFFMLELPITSHAVVTLFLSFIMFFNYFITSIIVNNENFYKHFLLKKLNIFLKIILFVIELVSYFVRPFSLGVRLFSNILSGHILIHIFFGAFLYAYKLSFWLSIIAFIMVLFILTMELFVSFVQSYIFFILNIIYMNDIFIKH